MKKILLLFGSLLIILGVLFYFINTPLRYILESNTNINSGKIAKAINILEEGSKKYPDNFKIAYLLAKACLLAGETEQASQIALKIFFSADFKKSKGYQNLLIGLSESNKRLGDEKLAKHFAYEYLKIHNKNEASIGIIKNYISIGQALPEKSTELWERAFSIASALKKAELKEDLRTLLMPKYFQLIEKYKAEKKYDDALNVILKALILGKNAELNYQEAIIYNTLGNVEKAEEEFEKALQLEPENDSYKIAYSNILENAVKKTTDKKKQSEYLEKIKLVLSSVKDDKKKVTLLNKVISLNSKYRITNTSLKVTMVGDYFYPSLAFKITKVSNDILKNFKVEFYDENKNKLDVYESPVTENEFDEVINVISRNPINDNNSVNAKLFVNNELVKEYTNK